MMREALEAAKVIIETEIPMLSDDAYAALDKIKEALSAAPALPQVGERLFLARKKLQSAQTLLRNAAETES